MLADNIVYLKKNDPSLYEAVKKREEEPTETVVILENAKNNKKTLKIEKNDKSLYIHSKYDPIREAEFIIDKLEECEKITEDTHVVFYGLGLGYHVKAFLKRYPKNYFSIFEPSIEVLSCYLDQVSLNSLPIRQIMSFQCEYDGKGINAFLNAIITGVKKEIIICELPPYQKVFDKEYKEFLNQFRSAIKSIRSSICTNYAFKQRWILNSVVNFKEVLRTPNILMENKGVFKGKTAILVSAGPSLDYEIENLKYIKEKKLAVIFTVGSAVNTLVHNNLYPDAMCTYDPQDNNYLAFTKVNELEIKSIPMIFGSSVGFETLEQYLGPKYHMITSQDTVSRYFLKTLQGDELQTVADAPSIAVVSLELLHRLGFEQIILVGQNLSYKDNKHYSDGIDYQIIIDQEKDEHLIKTIDVNGDTILTIDSFNLMKKQMEAYIKIFDTPVINTTIGGAKIEGTKFMPMTAVIKEKLGKNNSNGEEFKNILQSELYNKAYVKKQLTKMSDAFEVYKKLLRVMKQQLIKIDELVKNKNTKQAIMMYQKLDNLVGVLESNDYARVFALPMNRVEHELLAMNVLRVKKDSNELKKTGELVAYLNSFTNMLYGDFQLNKQIMELITERINSVFSENQEE